MNYLKALYQRKPEIFYWTFLAVCTVLFVGTMITLDYLIELAFPTYG